MKANNIHNRSLKSDCYNQNPAPSLIPLIMEGLVTGKPDGKNPEDLFVRTLVKKNRKVYETLLEGWKNMSKKEKRQKYSNYYNSSKNKSWVDRLEKQTKTLLEYQRQERRNLQKIINKEFHKTLSKGFTSWKPSNDLKKRKTLSYIVQKSIYERFGISQTSEDSCCTKSRANENSEVPSNYGLRLKKIECKEKDEIGHDEIYLISIVVDNTGNPILKTTNKFSMNDSDKNIEYPNEYLYPLRDPKGFLDFAATIWEDDGGYKEAATAAAALAASLAAIPDITATKVAAVALGVVAGLLAVGNWLDNDDKFGTISKTWSSETQLSEEIGEFTDSIINYDTGWKDFTSYHYDFYLDLQTV